MLFKKFNTTYLSIAGGGLRLFLLSFLLVLVGFHASADDKVIPPRPSPERLVNDFANMMSPAEQSQLEAKLENFARTTSNQIIIVTVKSLGDYDVSDFAIRLGKEWGVGKSGKNNGVVIVASLAERKVNISTGKGLEGALTDLTCGRIIRNEIVPEFKTLNYYQGFSKGADAVIAATKGEYKGDDSDRGGGGKRHLSVTAFVILIVFIIFIIRIFRGGKGGGGNYISGRGSGGFFTGMFLGSMLGGGGWGGGSSGGGGGDSGGGGFGGFGGGDFGGGGASGSW